MGAAREKREKLKRFKEEVLVFEVDYYRSDKSQKDVLAKPGAEKLRDNFGLGSRIVKTDRDIRLDGNAFVYMATTVEIFDQITGHVLAQCEGSANSREQMFQDGNPPDLVNAIGKMSQVRAFIGAVILGLGASDMFTQDLEQGTPPPPPTPIVGSPPVRPRQEVRPVERQTPPASPNAPRNPLMPDAKEPGEYVIDFGKYDGIALRDMPQQELRTYVDYLERDARERGRRLAGASGRLVYMAKRFFGEAVA